VHVIAFDTHLTPHTLGHSAVQRTIRHAVFLTLWRPSPTVHCCRRYIYKAYIPHGNSGRQRVIYSAPPDPL